jgi:hypothetical protein
MDATDVQQALGRYLFDLRHTPICGNFQTATLPECDLISVNREGYLCEWEIKISRSDFKADFGKTRKHECLAAGQGRFTRQRRQREGEVVQYHFLTCSYFSYACPAGLLQLTDIPVYAGLTWVYPDGRVTTLKQAPLLHVHKADADILRRINHNLTQKYLYGCSRATFASRGNPTPPAAPMPPPTPPLAPLKSKAPTPLAEGRRLKPRDPNPLRRKKRF